MHRTTATLLDTHQMSKKKTHQTFDVSKALWGQQSFPVLLCNLTRDVQRLTRAWVLTAPVCMPSVCCVATCRMYYEGKGVDRIDFEEANKVCKTCRTPDMHSVTAVLLALENTGHLWSARR